MNMMTGLGNVPVEQLHSAREPDVIHLPMGSVHH